MARRFACTTSTRSTSLRGRSGKQLGSHLIGSLFLLALALACSHLSSLGIVVFRCPTANLEQLTSFEAHLLGRRRGNFLGYLVGGKRIKRRSNTTAYHSYQTKHKISERDREREHKEIQEVYGLYRWSERSM